jgi:hypothetical protein
LGNRPGRERRRGRHRPRRPARAARAAEVGSHRRGRTAGPACPFQPRPGAWHRAMARADRSLTAPCPLAPAPPPPSATAKCLAPGHDLLA